MISVLLLLAKGSLMVAIFNRMQLVQTLYIQMIEYLEHLKSWTGPLEWELEVKDLLLDRPLRLQLIINGYLLEPHCD